jgi:hypothetical protein
MRKQLYYAFPIHNGLEKDDNLPLLLFNLGAD